MSKKSYNKKHLEEFMKHKFGSGWLSDFAEFLKKHKIISRGLSYAAPFLGKYGALAEVGSNLADKLGYGETKYSIKDLEKYAQHKFGGNWLGHLKDWMSKTYTKVKDHVNKHSNFYSGLLHEFKPVNKIAHFVADKIDLYDEPKKNLHKIIDDNVAFGKKKPMTKKAKEKKDKKIKDTPLKPMYGKGFKNGQIP